MSHVRSPPLELVSRFLPIYRWLVPRLNFLDRQFPGVVATSWYRDVAANERAGGDFFSQHRLAFAVDWDLPDRKDYRRFAEISAAIGLVPVVESDHVHVQVFRAGVVPRSLF